MLRNELSIEIHRPVGDVYAFFDSTPNQAVLLGWDPEVFGWAAVPGVRRVLQPLDFEGRTGREFEESIRIHLKSARADVDLEYRFEATLTGGTRIRLATSVEPRSRLSRLWFGLFGRFFEKAARARQERMLESVRQKVETIPARRPWRRSLLP